MSTESRSSKTPTLLSVDAPPSMARQRYRTAHTEWCKPRTAPLLSWTDSTIYASYLQHPISALKKFTVGGGGTSLDNVISRPQANFLTTIKLVVDLSIRADAKVNGDRSMHLADGTRLEVNDQ